MLQQTGVMKLGPNRVMRYSKKFGTSLKYMIIHKNDDINFMFEPNHPVAMLNINITIAAYSVLEVVKLLHLRSKEEVLPSKCSSYHTANRVKHKMPVGIHHDL